MITITLPDGSQKQFNSTTTAFQIAEAIGAGLARVALAAKVDGTIVDLSYPISEDANLSIITPRDTEGLEVIRHSTAHLLAHAVKELFSDVQVTIGPVIENGFYYDFSFPRGFTPEDLEAITVKMNELVQQDLPVKRFTMTRDEAVKFFQKLGEHYKVEIIQAIPGDEVLSFYQQGNFVDLCRGPHVPSTGRLKIFKLMSVAGAYWRGNSNNEMLQRIYGTAWSDKKDLADYLHRLEEAERRDHRKIAKALDLFHLQPEAPGMVFWHGNGWTLYQVVEQYIRKKLKDYNYQEIKTPQIASRSLWEKSGHWDKFAHEMFVTKSEDNDFAIKPMSCPLHVQVFNHGLHSYRDLPLRLAEFGSCHRNEFSGALHGLMRVRHLVQDDAHIFCTEDHIHQEVESLINLVHEVYHDFGFDDVEIRLSTRPENRVGSDEIWDKAENTLSSLLKEKNIPFTVYPGEGAFYGPKIDCFLRDCLGRIWQCGTIQLDFSMPERLGAKYIAEDSSRRTPVMIHRAILGSLERFLGILIEHYAGWFPTWLAPYQVVVMNITDNQSEYVRELRDAIKAKGYRAKADLRNEKVGFKIREQTLQRVPYQLVIGDKELANKTVSVRKRDGEDLGAMSLEQFFAILEQDVAKLGRV